MRKFLLSLALVLTLAFSSIAHAAKTYQVTGIVTKVTDKIITVEKSKEEKWEIDRDADTKITGDLKVGAKVTIEYTMTATKVDVKAAK
jgi:hypothetical protein